MKGYIRDVANAGQLATRAGLEGTLTLEVNSDKDEPPVKIRTDESGAFDVDLKLKPTAFGSCSVTADFSRPPATSAHAKQLHRKISRWPNTSPTPSK